jgi:anti-anti-sigma factor
MSLRFTCDLHDQVATISLFGKLLTDTHTAEITATVDKLITESVKYFVLNLSQLEQCNSSGLGFIVRTLTKARIKDGELIVCGIQGTVKTLFEISKLDSIITNYNNQEEAILHFSTVS